MQYDFIDPDVLGRLGALPLEARQSMIGNVAGRHRSPHRGSSVEFAEYRKYVQGDDTRRLDWKAYARSDRFYIKEFEADTNLRAYFVIDTSGSMGFQSEENPQKIQFARQLAGTLSYLIVNQGDAAGLTCSGEGISIEIPPARRASHLQKVFQTMSEAEPNGPTGLVENLHAVAEKAGRRALVVILSDLFVEADELADALQHLRYRKHDVVAFHLLDPLEINFDFQRPHRFIDMEDGTSIVAEPSLIADDYRAALQDFLSKTKTLCHDANVEYHRVRTDQSYEAVLQNFLEARLTAH